LQQRVLAGRSFTTVAGKAFRPRALELGPWRWVTLALALLYLFAVVVLPTLALIVAAFRRFLFIPTAASLFDMRHYSLVHFEAVFDNPLTMRSIWNTMEVGLATAVIGGIVAFAIGYTVHRSGAPARRAIDLIATLPVAIPGLVIGVAYLWAWIGLPGGLYGTIWILTLAFVARFMPDTMKSLSTSFLQIHRELEEAAAARGACAQPRLPAPTALARRTAQQSRRAAAPAPARRLAPHHQANRSHRGLRDPRPGGSRGARRPRRRHA